MMKVRAALALKTALFLAFTPLSQASPFLKQEMLDHLSLVKHYFSVKYAPKEWKANWCGWDLNSEVKAAAEELAAKETPSVKEYRALLKKLFLSTRDYHVHLVFYSNEWSALPFAVKGIQGRYYISALDEEAFPLEQFPVSVGDELVEFDGKSPEEAIQALIENELPRANPETDRALAELFLTLRGGASGMTIPKGSVEVKVRSREENRLLAYQLAWEHSPERMPQYNVPQAPPVRPPSYRNKPLLSRQMKTSLFCGGPEKRLLRHPNELGRRESFLPKLGMPLWEGPDYSPFDCYIYQHPSGKRIGYLRIPHYSFDEEEAELFAGLVLILESETDALVIDQLNNVGGNAFFLYTLLSTLTEKPLKTPRHRMTVSSEDVWEAWLALDELEEIRDSEEAKELLGRETLFGYPVDYQMIKLLEGYYRFLIEEWQRGKSLTEPFYIWGVDAINPHPEARYTKPILVLINGLDFSGGDFFPAILQDNGRATLIGSTTAGAGGYIDELSFPNLYGIESMRVTASFAERVDTQPIENLGVTPDIWLELSENDLVDGYADYTRAVNEAIDKLVEEP